MIRGWCPSLYEPMPTGDGLLVRVKPRAGRLSASAARLVASEAARHGKGALELTSRASLQVRGLSAESVGPFARAMVAAGLASADKGAERRRSVVVSALADSAAVAIAAGLEDALEADAGLATLPAKFGVCVGDDGLADIRVRVFADHAELGCDGSAEVARVRLDEAVAATMRLAHALPGGLRMRQAGAATVAASAGLSLGPATAGSAVRPWIGKVAERAFGAGLPFGSTTARVWSALADLAEGYGDGGLRLTPRRAVLIAGIAPWRVSGLGAALAELGLITDPDDHRLRVFACPGQPACATATVVTRIVAARLRPKPGETIHVAGCDKGCAHPGPASITWVGRDGGFDLVQDGRAGDPPVRRGLNPAEVFLR